MSLEKTRGSLSKNTLVGGEFASISCNQQYVRILHVADLQFDNLKNQSVKTIAVGNLNKFGSNKSRAYSVSETILEYFSYTLCYILLRGQFPLSNSVATNES